MRVSVALPCPNDAVFATAVILYLPRVGTFDGGYVELLHLQERVHDALGLGGVGIRHHLRYCRRDDLPGEAIFVIEPTAGTFFAPLGELAPVMVDFGLGLAPRLERDCFVEFEVRAAVQRRECLSG